ncbi:putative F-box domain, FBD domain, leucine-rich repeat domain, L domain-containing protein [Rosa chinensis]|uniref:Putative F-box domain, FBD domain, leucine-rich repeat domain, L domain-containing protein n=1 Tax=Rosa chinensis TaxID=74649 RepID=A0A2P6QPM0_ROSCH|nr:putative F-box domain, FBD domain, leucine-rich repeat domain, L domain-containing protein [Rosa chinensis]
MKDSGDHKRAHEDSKSQLQAAEGIGDDRISALPDEILCHILSLLIPLYSVRTTVLSKRWNNLWTSCITNLDFDMYDFRSSRDNYRIFVTFVDRVLALRDSSLDIRRFRVDWVDYEDFSITDRWIRAAIKANVVELVVSLSVDCCGEPDLVRPFEMPRSVFTCKSLVALKVKSDYLTYSLPTTGCCFPNLKFLHFSSRHNSDSAFEENLFRSCPVLEELTIEGHHKKDVLNFNISAPELRTLTTIISEESDEEFDESDEDSGGEGSGEYRVEPCNFFIDAPKLENLCVAGEVMSTYILENSTSLVQAKVQLQEFHEACADRVAEFLDRISSVRYMVLSAPDFKPCLPHVFSNLIKLELVFYNQSCWKWLADVLNISPNLEYLVLDFAKIKSGGRDSLPDLESFGDDFASINMREGWDSFHPPEFFPRCLSSQLKTISIKGFKGTPNEIGVAVYLLIYGEVLNKVIVSCESCSSIRGAKEKILSFVKGSKTCQVSFI